MSAHKPHRRLSQTPATNHQHHQSQRRRPAYAKAVQHQPPRTSLNVLEHPIAPAPELAASAGSLRLQIKRGELRSRHTGTVSAANEEVERMVGLGGTVVPPGGGNPVPSPSAPGAGRSSPLTIPKAIRGPRPQASLTAGCITTPCPSLTSSCSSTTIYGCGSLTERQTPPHRRGPARQRSCQSPRALRHASGRRWPSKATGRKRQYPADPWLRSPVVKAGLSEPAVDSRGGAGVPTADLARCGPSEVAGSVQPKRLR